MTLKHRLSASLAEAEKHPARHSTPVTIHNGVPGAATTRAQFKILRHETHLQISNVQAMPTRADLQKVLAALPYPEPTLIHQPHVSKEAGRWYLRVAWHTPTRLIPDDAPAEEKEE